MIHGVKALAAQDGMNGSPLEYLIAGHASAIGISSSPISGPPSNSPEAMLSTMMQEGYQLGQPIEVLACLTASPNNLLYGVSGVPGSPITVNGNLPGVKFLTTLANLSGSSDVMGFNGYDNLAANGSYDVTNQQVNETTNTVGNIPGFFPGPQNTGAIVNLVSAYHGLLP